MRKLLAAALVAGVGAFAWAEDAPEEEVVAVGEAEFWLGGDEIAVASGESELWLGPDEIAVATDEKVFPLVVFRTLRADDDIAAALQASGAVDKNRIIGLIGSSPVAYQAFKAWAEGLGDIAVMNSGHAGDSFAFGVEELFENAPVVWFTDVSVNPNATGALDVAVTVKDGDSDKPVSPANVAQRFEATTNVADWTEGRVEVDVTDRTGTEKVATPVKFTVKFADDQAKKAFLRIRK